MAVVGFDVFNFTYEVDIAEAKAKMGHRVAMMGNVPPLSIGVCETPDVVARWSKECLDKAAPGGGMILSVGGDISPDMPDFKDDFIKKGNFIVLVFVLFIPSFDIAILFWSCQQLS